MRTLQAQPRRRFLKSFVLAGAAALTTPHVSRLARAGTPHDAVQGLRAKIDHIVVFFQENRSFDHYFGTYRHPAGAIVRNLLDRGGRIDSRFTGLQKNPAGIPYNWLPVPDEIPGFDAALLDNRPFHLAPYIPATHNVPWDPEHHFFRMAAQIDHGRMDQFVALAQSKHHAPFSNLSESIDPLQMSFAESKPSGAVIGFYDRSDVAGYHELADQYVLFDNFFQAMTGGSTGNALYLVAARSAVWRAAPRRLVGSLTPPVFDLPYDADGIMINDLPPLNGPTSTDVGRLRAAPPAIEQTYPSIGDRLSEAGISWSWYNEGWNGVKPWALKSAFGPGDGSMVVETPSLYVPWHNPFQYYPSWQGNVRAGHIRDAADFLDDLRSGNLPQVSFIKACGAHDEHPADSAPAWGIEWVMQHLRGLGNSALWEKTAVVVTYDEGGGFWDHMPPPQIDSYGCGTRIPALLVSSWARRGYVDHRFATSSSVLALIEARFGLQPLQKRDAEAYGLLDGFDFTQAPREPIFS